MPAVVSIPLKFPLAFPSATLYMRVNIFS